MADGVGLGTEVGTGVAVGTGVTGVGATVGVGLEVGTGVAVGAGVLLAPGLHFRTISFLVRETTFSSVEQVTLTFSSGFIFKSASRVAAATVDVATTSNSRIVIRLFIEALLYARWMWTACRATAATSLIPANVTEKPMVAE